jgi:succinate dehydrogenase/fumarate reductase flavoprotein subunit
MSDREEIDGQLETGEKQGLTRRSFLGAAAVAGAAAGLVGGPVANAFASGGSGWAEKDAANIVWDKECDILVVGTGFAGMCAAIEAYDAGTHDILVIDKNSADTLGGNSIQSGGNAQMGGTAIEKTPSAAVLAKYPDTPNDTVQWMIDDINHLEGDCRANQDVLRTLIEKCPDTVAWAATKLKIKYRDLGFQVGMRPTVARVHTPAASTLPQTDPDWYPGSAGISWFYRMYKYLTDNGIALNERILPKHQAVKFIQAGDDGPVVGMEVQDLAGGKTLNVRTRKGVVLGAGGWKGNVAMRLNWDPRFGDDYYSSGAPYTVCNGEMVMAANDIGADLTGMDFVGEVSCKWGTQIYQYWQTGITNPIQSAGISAPPWASSICVDINGKRFVDEYSSNQPEGEEFCEAHAKMMDRPRAIWAIADSAKAPAAWKTAITTIAGQPSDDVLHATTPFLWRDMVVSAATLDGLADAMKLGATAKAAFLAEVAKYNGYVDKALLDPTNAVSFDADFGKPNNQMLAKVATGPFYAVKAKFLAHDQMSGITVNTKGQVVKRDSHIGPAVVPIDQQAVIERLYAAGEIAGGYYGNKRGHGKIGIIMNAGRIAGAAVAKETPVGAGVTALAVKSSAANAVHGHSVKITGTLSGVQGLPTGAVVQLQARVPGKATYANVGAPMAISAARTAAKSYKLAKKGNYFFRMKFAGTTSFAPCTSKSVKVVSK